MRLRSPLFRKVDCISLPVDDLEEALQFYQQALGHELIWRDDTAAGLRLPDSTAELDSDHKVVGNRPLTQRRK